MVPDQGVLVLRSDMLFPRMTSRLNVDAARGGERRGVVTDYHDGAATMVDRWLRA
jgi:hypothetical protein